MTCSHTRLEDSVHPTSTTGTGPPAPPAARRYLMCPPVYFDVVYEINPWMDVTKPVDAGLALTQWERLRDQFRDLGHEVSEMTPVQGLPDMVFTANGAIVAGGRVLLANFRYGQRAAETQAHRDWFRGHGFAQVRTARCTNEGEGDCLLAGDWFLCGTGFRTSQQAHREIQEELGRPVIGLSLVDPRFYHLDTALAVLSGGDIMYYPAAFSAGSQETLRRLYPDAILATAADAEVFGLNAVCDGRHVVLPQAATGLITQLRQRGYTPIGVDVSELNKAGGAVKCCTLELRSA
jgi:N-dimethylarginine dimethylaminohydrolase